MKRLMVILNIALSLSPFVVGCAAPPAETSKVVVTQIVEVEGKAVIEEVEVTTESASGGAQEQVEELSPQEVVLTRDACSCNALCLKFNVELYTMDVGAMSREKRTRVVLPGGDFYTACVDDNWNEIGDWDHFAIEAWFDKEYAKFLQDSDCDVGLKLYVPGQDSPHSEIRVGQVGTYIEGGVTSAITVNTPPLPAGTYRIRLYSKDVLCSSCSPTIDVSFFDSCEDDWRSSPPPNFTFPD